MGLQDILQSSSRCSRYAFLKIKSRRNLQDLLDISKIISRKFAKNFCRFLTDVLKKILTILQISSRFSSRKHIHIAHTNIFKKSVRDLLENWYTTLRVIFENGSPQLFNRQYMAVCKFSCGFFSVG